MLQGHGVVREALGQPGGEQVVAAVDVVALVAVSEDEEGIGVEPEQVDQVEGGLLVVLQAILAAVGHVEHHVQREVLVDGEPAIEPRGEGLEIQRLEGRVVALGCIEVGLDVIDDRDELHQQGVVVHLGAVDPEGLRGEAGVGPSEAIVELEPELLRQGPQRCVVGVDELAPQLADLPLGVQIPAREHATAESLGGLVEGHGGAGLLESMGAQQPRDATPHDRDAVLPLGLLVGSTAPACSWKRGQGQGAARSRQQLTTGRSGTAASLGRGGANGIGITQTVGPGEAGERDQVLEVMEQSGAGHVPPRYLDAGSSGVDQRVGSPFASNDDSGSGRGRPHPALRPGSGSGSLHRVHRGKLEQGALDGEEDRLAKTGGAVQQAVARGGREPRRWAASRAAARRPRAEHGR